MYLSRKKIVNDKHEILLTMNPRARYVISGHLFEMIEYFYYLRFWKHRDVGILLPQYIKEEEIRKILHRYTFTEEEIQIYIDNITCVIDPLFIRGNIVFLVDGNYQDDDETIIVANKLCAFQCFGYNSHTKFNTVFQDTRVFPKHENTVHYVKKILLSKYPEISQEHDGSAMIYCGTGGKELSIDDIKRLIEQYPFDKYKIYTVHDLSDYDDLNDKRVTVEKFPVQDQWNFGTHIYAYIGNIDGLNNMDCSNRLLAECAYYNKQIIYGTKYCSAVGVRRKDIETDLKLVTLSPDDELNDYL